MFMSRYLSLLCEFCGYIKSNLRNLKYRKTSWNQYICKNTYKRKLIHAEAVMKEKKNENLNKSNNDKYQYKLIIFGRI